VRAVAVVWAARPSGLSSRSVAAYSPSTTAAGTRSRQRRRIDLGEVVVGVAPVQEHGQAEVCG